MIGIKPAAPLAGLTILLVEDQYLLADELRGMLAAAGADVLGPVGTVSAALALISRTSPDLAVLDVNLRRETVFPVAEALRRAGAPFIFVTGYEDWVIPQIYRDAPILEKPVSAPALVRAAEALCPAHVESLQ